MMMSKQVELEPLSNKSKLKHQFKKRARRRQAIVFERENNDDPN